MKINLGQILSGLLVFFVAIIEALLALRFGLLLLAANSNADFTLMIFEASEPFASPFEGVFPSFEAVNFTFESSTLLAMFVYGIVAGIFYFLAKNIGSVNIKPKTSNEPMMQVNSEPSQPQTAQQYPLPQTTPPTNPNYPPQNYANQTTPQQTAQTSPFQQPVQNQQTTQPNQTSPYTQTTPSQQPNQQPPQNNFSQTTPATNTPTSFNNLGNNPENKPDFQ